jgi:hypothetical protein
MLVQAVLTLSNRKVKQMDEDREHNPIRRSLIKNGIGALAGIAIVSLSSNRVSAAEKKLAKATVHYQDASKDQGRDCDDCVHFISGKTEEALGTCRLVEGEINPHGHCDAFSPKARS